MYFKNNRTALIFLLAMLVVAPIKAQVVFGDAAKFNDGWLFRLTDDSAIVRTDYDDSEWRKLSLPHDWSIEGQLSPTLASCTGYLPGGIGWYRKHFRVEDNATRHYIYFEGVYNRSEVYLNGHLLGRRPNGYVSFLYDMTPYLKEGDNMLAVRVDHSRYADSRWYTGSGIYRDVWLVAAPDTHIAQWGVGWHAASLTDKQAVVAVDVEVEKHKATSDKLELKASLYDTAGKKVAQRRVRVADGKEGIAKQSLDLKVSKPHRWNLDNPYLYTGYLPGGIGWYRKHFRVEDNATRHYIYFEGVYNRSEVYLNGHLLGRRPNGYVSFLYDMTPYLKEGDNMLAVRVDHSRYADSRWYTGSGIYRDVWLVAAPDTHIAQWGVGWHAASLTDKQAVVAVDVEVEKHKATSDKLELKASLYDTAGKKVAQRRVRVADGKEGIAKQSLDLKVSKPHRWNLDNPYLYTLKTELLANGKRIDGSETKVGLRTLEFDANKGFALNGNWMKVKGVCLHHDAGVLGAVVPPEVWERRLNNLKGIGVNAIRMSHNPQAPVLYELCDRLGFLVMDEVSDEWEFPKRKWVQGWNVGTPSYDGTFDFFEEWIERDVTDMVRRDRNHTCIFLWSIGNEVDYPNDPYSHPVLDGAKINQPMFGGYKPDAPDAMRIGTIAKRLAACVRAVDTSRPVTGALAGVVMSNETEYPDAVDVVGYNYTENRYDQDHATYPDRIIYGSETGSGLDAWYAVRDKDFIFGQFIWTGTDYLGESGRWPSRGLYTGLLDFGSFPKPRGHFRASLWCENPVTYAGTYPVYVNPKHPEHVFLSPDAWDIWNYDEGQNIRVVCYTNAPQARLLLNGRVVGEMKPYDEKTGIIYWDIPFRAGELRAEGCDKEGNALSSYSIRTSGRPYAIRATADRTILFGDRATAHITVEVVDEEGTVVKLGDNEITCTVEGAARLLGLEGSDNSDMSDYTDNRHRVYHGRLLAYIQTTGGEGPVKVKFASPLLKGTEVKFEVGQ